MEQNGVDKKISKRLVFDRRYGWVIDEWKDPSEEALSGARGMFCILPLANAFVKATTQSINLAATSAVKVFVRPDDFSPQALQASLNYRFQDLLSSLQKQNFNLFNSKGKSTLLSSSCFEHVHVEKNDSQSGSSYH
ncbi:hypothetical protein IFM89_022943 [Coptis chinensis]|uniref:Uncharacterized protein n=1 Tax=Coptis chinensis TaxID=261450 RepID=A0A835HJB9_9MAGN|nr:hypothetical protein IFM89_022943 [Coptis chinensis]